MELEEIIVNDDLGFGLRKSGNVYVLNLSSYGSDLTNIKNKIINYLPEYHIRANVTLISTSSNKTYPAYLNMNMISVSCSYQTAIDTYSEYSGNISKIYGTMVWIK